MIITDGVIDVSDLPIICWRNLVTSTNVAAESDPDFPVSNVGNPSTALKWKQDFVGSPVNVVEYLEMDLAAATVNYVAIGGHNLASAGIAVGLEIAFSGSPVGSATELISPQIPLDDGPLVFLFTEQTEVEALRLRFTTTATAGEIAVLYAGQYTELPEGIQADHTPLPLATVQDIVNGRSENGAFLGRIVLGEQLSSVANIANLDLDWIRDELVPFLEFAAGAPFFWLWSPESYPNETAFAWLDNDAQPVMDIDGYAAIALSMKGLGT